MEYILNGQELSTCMIGTWSWGSGSNGSKMVFGQSFTKEQLKETFDTAYNLGFNFWDTAEVYGMGTSEQILGECIKDKDNVIISTKHMPGGRYSDGENRRAIEGSLARIGISSIDLYWLHSPKNVAKNMEELAQCQKDGLIKSIGLSNGSVEQIKIAQETLAKYDIKLAAIQNHYSLLAMDREEEVRKYCMEKGILFFGYMLLEQGALSGHYDYKHHFEAFSMRGLSFGKGKFKKIDNLLQYMRKLAEKYDVDPSQIPIAWAINKGIIPIVGMNKARHAEPLSKGIKLELAQAEIDSLEELARNSGVKCKGIWE